MIKFIVTTLFLGAREFLTTDQSDFCSLDPITQKGLENIIAVLEHEFFNFQY